MQKDSGKVNIHGKEYLTVAYRVGQFREKFPGHALTTEIIDRTLEDVVMVAKIYNPDGVLVATGHAEEQRKASQINRTSALENAETSAIGRALAALGLCGTEFASADEVANAIHQQNAPKRQAEPPASVNRATPSVTLPPEDFKPAKKDEMELLRDALIKIGFTAPAARANFIAKHAGGKKPHELSSEDVVELFRLAVDRYNAANQAIVEEVFPGAEAVDHKEG